MHPINQERGIKGVPKQYCELRIDKEKFSIYVRMQTDSFNKLLELVYNNLKKLDTNCRLAVDPTTKLFLTLKVSNYLIIIYVTVEIYRQITKL